MKASDLASLWSYAHEKWPNYPLPELGSPAAAMRAEAWTVEFGDLPAAAVRAAMCDPSLSRRDFFPALGLLRAAALRALGHDAAPDPDEAWLAVRSTAAGGADDELRAVLHPAVARAAEAVGWRDLRQGENQDALRAHFLRFYESASVRYARETETPPAAALEPAAGPRALRPGRG
jgi:hypothetical protein